jgi:hypothetical protein
MNHHLEAALTGISRTLNDDCCINALLKIQERIQIALEKESIKQGIQELINNTINQPEYSNDPNKPILEYQRVSDNYLRNRHDFKVKHVSGKDLWGCGMSRNIRGKIPYYNDNVVLGSVLAGVHNESVEAGVLYHKEYIAEKLGYLGEKLSWFKEESFESYKESYCSGDSLDDKETNEWFNDKFKSDLHKINSSINSAKKVIQFSVSKNVEELSEAIKNMTALKDTDDIYNSQEIKIVEKKLTNTIELLNEIANPKIKKSRKFKI